VGARFGARRAFIAGLAISTLANGLLLLSESLPASLHTGWLLSWWLPRWLGTALVAVNSTPYLMGITQRGERPYAFAFHQAVMGLAALLGSVFAGILPGMVAAHGGLALDAAAPFRTVLWLTPLTYTLAVLVLLGTRPVTAPDSPVAAPPAGPKPLGLMAFFGMVVFLQMMGEGTVRGFFNLYLDAGLGVAMAQIGLLMGVGQLLPVLVALCAPLVMARWGAGQTLSAATLGMALSVLVLALVPSRMGAVAAGMGVTAMAALVGPARSVFSQEAVRPAWRTAIATATTLGSSLGGSAAGWSGGVLLPIVGYPGLFTLGAVFAAMAAGLLQGYLRRAPADAPDLAAAPTWTRA
jgi:MFS family permease